MPIIKRGLNRSSNSFVFDTVGVLPFGPPITLGAGVANTTVQGAIVLPVACKIQFLTISCTAIDSLTGTDKVNVVVGTGAYTQGTVNPTDNSDVSTVAGNASGPTGGFGYPTVYGAAGQALFSADQLLSVGTGVGVATTTGQPALATQTTGAGGVWRFVPTDYDGVLPAGTLLTLRAVTTAATGAITNLVASLAYVPVFTRGELPYYTDVIVTPGIDF